MNKRGSSSGTEKEITPAQILAAELEKIQLDKDRMKEESAAYMKRHPEIGSLIDELMASILHHKPSDVIKFAAQFFNGKRDPTKVGLAPLVIAGPSGCIRTILLFSIYLQL